MKDEEAKKILFQASIELTRGVLANPASAAMLNDSYQKYWNRMEDCHSCGVFRFKCPGFVKRHFICPPDEGDE